MPLTTKIDLAGRRRLTAFLIAAIAAFCLIGVSRADAAFNGAFCGTTSSPVHLASGNACIHGAKHDDYTLVYGESVGTAYVRIGISTSSSSELPNSAGTATSICGGCNISMSWSGVGNYGPAGYAFLHNHSTFPSDFDGWISGA